MTDDVSHGFPCIVAYCRPGFEAECAAEIQQQAADYGCPVETRTQDGLVFAGGNATRLGRQLDVRELVFTRQWFLAGAEAVLDPQNRVAGIVAACGGARGTGLFIESSDSESGRELRRLCRAIAAPLERALESAGLLVERGAACLHVLFLDGGHALVGQAPLDRSHAEPMGILRLRMPRDAPSRSTLKLAEALQEFIPQEAWAERLRPGMRVVDLGASPGGWTYQMVRLGLQVIAVDNGRMDARLMATGQVEHRHCDAFTFKPDRRVDWLLCDIVDKPMRVAQLLARWLGSGWCREAIVNLKLPMRRRYAELERCLQVIRAPLHDRHRTGVMRAKQLYHDREEVTLHVRCNGPARRSAKP